MKNQVLWICRACGNEWKGKSPRSRSVRPHCSKCGSWSVKVKDWLFDKELWEKTKLRVLNRGHWQCQSCKKELKKSAVIHHISYDEDYYRLENLISLCNHCHFLIHGKSRSYVNGAKAQIFGILAIFIGIIQIFGAVSGIITSLILALVCLPTGIGLIIYSLKLTKATRKAKKAIRKATRKLPVRTYETFSDEREVNFPQPNETLYCRECGREISEWEFHEFGGLCKMCRGMPLQKGFPSPPGFPKL